MNLTINNRELLRNYRQLKTKLLSGEIHEIRIIQGNGGKIIKLTTEEDMSPTERILQMVKEHGPIYIKRPEGDIFDW